MGPINAPKAPHQGPSHQDRRRQLADHRAGRHSSRVRIRLAIWEPSHWLITSPSGWPTGLSS